MRIAILESDAVALDRALETLSSAGHLCFGALCDQTLRTLVNQVVVDLVLLDWVAPDPLRYDTLRGLCSHGSVIPVVLCVTSRTSQQVVAAGLKGGANICLQKPLGSAQSLAHIHAFCASWQSFQMNGSMLADGSVALAPFH